MNAAGMSTTATASVRREQHLRGLQRTCKRDKQQRARVQESISHHTSANSGTSLETLDSACGRCFAEQRRHESDDLRLA